jgi:Zn-dependent alcohol dehydrogenase
MRGELPIDKYVSHVFDGIDKVNDSIHALHSGDCIRAVVKISDSKVVDKLPKVINNV